jgi:hypothetical protein
MAAGKKTATKRKARARKPKPNVAECQVQGCTNLPLAQRDGRDGKVWLCGRCAEIADRSLAGAAREEEVLDMIGTAMEKAQATKKARQQKKVRAVLLG